jgi:hypothetical protein
MHRPPVLVAQRADKPGREVRYYRRFRWTYDPPAPAPAIAGGHKQRHRHNHDCDGKNGDPWSRKQADPASTYLRGCAAGRIPGTANVISALSLPCSVLSWQVQLFM